MRRLQVLADGGCFYEGSRWRDGRLWFSDCYNVAQTFSMAEDGTDLRVEAHVPGQPSGQGALPDGRLLVVSMQDRRILRRERDGRLVTHADLSGIAKGQINDMAVDPAGRCWVGCLGFDIKAGAPMEPAVLIRVDVDGQAQVAADDVWFPNGIVCNGTGLVVAETFHNRMSAFDIRSDGTLTNQREWARFGALPASRAVHEIIPQLDVAPDGLANPDAEGAIWAADAFHGRAVRVQEGGRILDEIRVPAGHVYDATLGGADGRTLFLATSSNGPAEAETENTRRSRIVSARVEVAVA